MQSGVLVSAQMNLLYSYPLQYAPESEAKYYRIPAAFAGKSLETLYADYLALLDEAKVEVSMLRRTEDTVYESQINELTEGLKGVE